MGTLGGYGTVTPAWGWEFSCGKCVKVADKTATALGQTPSPTPAATNTPTLTPTPSYENEDIDYLIDFSVYPSAIYEVTRGEWLSNEIASFDGGDPGDGGYERAAVEIDMPEDCILMKDVFADYKTSSSAGGINFWHTEHSGGYFFGDETSIGGYNWQTSAVFLASGVATDKLIVHVVNFDYNGGAREAYLDNVGFTCETEVLVVAPTATPTITPSPTATYAPGVDSKCANIDGTGAGSVYDGDFFALPIPRVGEATCLAFDPIFLLTDPFGLGDLEIPGVSLCVRPVLLGQLIVFGVAFNMDSLLTAFAMLWLLARMLLGRTA